MNRRISIILICLAIMLFLGAFFAFLAINRPPGKPKLVMSFAGYTNDPSGVRLATFAISNASSWAVTCGSRYCIQLPAGEKWTNLAEGWFPSGGSTLKAGTSENIVLPAPTNQSSWRVAIATSKYEGAIMSIATELLIEGEKLGLPTRYRRVGHWAFSNSVQEQP